MGVATAKQSQESSAGGGPPKLERRVCQSERSSIEGRGRRPCSGSFAGVFESEAKLCRKRSEIPRRQIARESLRRSARAAAAPGFRQRQNILLGFTRHTKLRQIKCIVLALN